MIVAAVAIAVLAVVYAEGVWKIIVAVIVAAVYPMLITYIEIAMVSKGLIDSVGDFVNPIKEEVVDTPIVTENTEDDYIFVNGRMVKNPNKKNKSKRRINAAFFLLDCIFLCNYRPICSLGEGQVFCLRIL